MCYIHLDGSYFDGSQFCYQPHRLSVVYYYISMRMTGTMCYFTLGQLCFLLARISILNRVDYLLSTPILSYFSVYNRI
jgi:hypothetical protein